VLTTNQSAYSFDSVTRVSWFVCEYNLYQCVVLSMYCLNNIGSPVNDVRVSEKN